MLPDGDERHVQPKAMEVLLCLAESHHELVERRVLLEQVWGEDGVSDAQLTKCVGELRHALDDHPENPCFIQTLHKRGYRLVAPLNLGTVEDQSGSGVGPHEGRSAGPADEASTEAGSFWDELKRRRVVRGLLAYLAVAWACTEVAATVLPALRFPDWTVTLVAVTAVAGIPVAAIGFWVLQKVPEGVVVDLPHRPESGQTRKGRLDLVIIGALVIAVGVLAYQLFMKAPETPTHDELSTDTAAAAFSANTLAVLPFMIIGGDPDMEYFGDGLAEELTNLFAKLPGLHVASRTAAFYFKHRNEELGLIARKLSTRYILEGSVRRDRDRIRVMAQLIDMETGYHLWSNDYEKPVEEIFDIRHDIAQEVARRMDVPLSPEIDRMLSDRPTDRIEAFDLYLRARRYLDQPHSAPVLDTAIDLFRQAIDIDPRFARAHAGVCEAEQWYYELDSNADRFSRAEKSCHRALTLDDKQPEVRIALGDLYRRSGQYEKAELEYSAARRLDPRSDAAAVGLGRVYRARDQLGRAEEEFRYAIRLQPGYWLNHNALGRLFMRMSQYEEAAETFRVVIDLSPDNHLGFTNLGAALYFMGDTEGAAEAWARSTELSPSAIVYGNLGLLYYYDRRFVDAARAQEKALELAPDEPRAYGRLAASQRMVPHLAGESDANFRMAAQLMETKLTLNPDDGRRTARLATYYAALGRHEDAEAAISRSLELAPDIPESRYFAAKVRLAAGDQEGAVVELTRALELGYSSSLAEADPQLDPLRESGHLSVVLASNDPDDNKREGKER